MINNFIIPLYNVVEVYSMNLLNLFVTIVHEYKLNIDIVDSELGLNRKGMK